jgi:hypothetical protein
LTRKLSEYKDTKIVGKENTFEFEDIDIKGLLSCFKEVKNAI